MPRVECQCGNVVKVAGTAGRKAKCPECGRSVALGPAHRKRGQGTGGPKVGLLLLIVGVVAGAGVSAYLALRGKSGTPTGSGTTGREPAGGAKADGTAKGVPPAAKSDSGGPKAAGTVRVTLENPRVEWLGNPPMVQVLVDWKASGDVKFKSWYFCSVSIKNAAGRAVKYHVQEFPGYNLLDRKMRGSAVNLNIPVESPGPAGIAVCDVQMEEALEKDGPRRLLHKLTDVPIGGKPPVYVAPDLRVELFNPRVERVTAKSVRVSVSYRFSGSPDPTKIYRCKIAFNGVGEAGATEVGSLIGRTGTKEGTWTDPNASPPDGSDAKSCELMVLEESGGSFRLKQIASLPNVPIKERPGK